MQRQQLEYESDELIVAASIPAIATPANNEGNNSVDIKIKILPLSLC